MSYFRNLPIRIKLFLYLSTAFLLSLTTGSVFIYSYIQKTVNVDIEDRLQSATGMVANMVRIAMQTSKKHHLRMIVDQNLKIIDHYRRMVKSGEVSSREAQRRVTEIMLSQSIGQTGYLFALNIQNAPERIPAVVHPHVQGQDLAYLSSVQEMASKKTGYLEFEWKDPGEQKLQQKAAYYAHFEPWGWILAASLNRNEHPGATRIEDFREKILASRFGKSGHSYIIDGSGNIILHSYLKGNYFNATDTEGRMFIKEICQKKNGQITYSWKSPEMKKKVNVLAAFQFIPEFDWIVVSSVNLDEFYTPLFYVRNLVIATFLFSLILAFLLSFWSSSLFTGPVARLKKIFEKGAFGDTSLRMETDTHDEIGQLAVYFNAFMETLEYNKLALEEEIRERKDIEKRLIRQNLNQTRRMELHDKMQGELDGKTLAANILDYFIHRLGAKVAALYVAGPDADLRLLGTLGPVMGKAFSRAVRFGEGLLGQVASEKKPLLVTAVAEKNPHDDEEILPNILIHPLLQGADLKGIIEVRSSNAFAEEEISFLEEMSDNLASALSSLAYREEMENLLKQTQELAHQLQERQKELSESNAALEEQTNLLIRQKESIEQKNRDLENAKGLIAKKAKDLESANHYKLQFLANMSHELRTPLNSILILSKLLSENKSGPLTEKQKELVETIHTSGSDLLRLINEILDLSKIEAGKMELHLSEQPLNDHVQRMERYFGRLAQEKGLEFKTHIDPDVPAQIITDHQRLDQVIINLLTNAFKFTAEGSVRLRIGRPPADLRLENSRLDPKAVLAFAVFDTGIGIRPGNEAIIFEAFQQGDGSISRKYGGTGLGLSISKQLSSLLGGEIHVKSQEGKGSTFILYLPMQTNRRQGEDQKRPLINAGLLEKKESLSMDLEVDLERGADVEAIPEPATGPSLTSSARSLTESILPDESILKGKTILVIDDDMRNAFALTSLFEGKGMRVLIGRDGKEGLRQMEANPGISAVLVDIMMPEMNGFETIKTIRNKKKFKHLPIIAVTAMAMKGDREACLQAGADDYLAKPFDAGTLTSLLCAQLANFTANLSR